MMLLRIDEAPAVPVAERQSLLQAALAAGLDLPHGCRSGLCGACRVRLLEGEIRCGAHSAAALSDAERAQGLILACRASALSDVRIARIASPQRRPRPRRATAKLAVAEPLGALVLGLRLLPPAGGVAFLPGQYAALTLPGRPPRDFSFAGLPGDPRMEFHIAAGDPARLAELLAVLRPGADIGLEGPFGLAHFRPEDPGPLLLVAGGTGLAPMLSVARAALAAAPERPIRLIRARPPAGDAYGAEPLRLLARTSQRFALQEVAGEAVVEAAASAWTGATVHAAGPPSLIEALHRAAGRPAGRPAVLRSDPFAPVG